LRPGEFLVINCDPDRPPSATAEAALNTAFGLSAAGDGVYLYEPAGALQDSIVFGGQAAGFSIGFAIGAFSPRQLLLPTPGAVNIPAATSSAAGLRINEWAASVNAGPDWFEVYNSQAQPVALGGLFLTDRLTDRTKQEIPPLTFIGTGTNGFLRFIADNTPAQGPLQVAFSLDADGEALGLFPPGTAPAIDTVAFGPQTPEITEGRFPDGSDGREFFALPTPGAANVSNNPNPVDVDADGMADAWERQYGLSVGVNDSKLDADSDGATNLEEFLGGTSPVNPASRLAIQFVRRTTGGVELAFSAEPGRSYSVLYKDVLQQTDWAKLTDVPVQTSLVVVILPDSLPAGVSARFYRIVTPAEPYR
jgi:hypothetical protein